MYVYEPYDQARPVRNASKRMVLEDTVENFATSATSQTGRTARAASHSSSSTSSGSTSSSILVLLIGVRLTGIRGLAGVGLVWVSMARHHLLMGDLYCISRQTIANRGVLTGGPCCCLPISIAHLLIYPSVLTHNHTTVVDLGSPFLLLHKRWDRDTASVHFQNSYLAC